jgi:hypothetical protein
MIHNGLAPAPLGQGWCQPWPRGAALLTRRKAVQPWVTTPESFNQVVPFYVATSGPLLHVHSQTDLEAYLQRQTVPARTKQEAP